MTGRRWLAPHHRHSLRRLASRSREIVLLAAATGVVTGAFVALFEWVVVEVAFARVLELDVGVMAMLPAVGLLASVAIRRFVGGNVSSATTDEYLHAFHDVEHELDGRAFAGRMLAAVVTLGSGAPMGLEGPSLYAGATIGSALQRRLPSVFRDTSRRVLLVAGAAAGVAAIFKAPATGAVFALEVPYQDDLARRMLLPALVAAATGYLTFVAINGTAPLFPVAGDPGFAARELLGAIGVGIIAGLGARLFARLLRLAKQITAAAHPVARALLAGGVLAGFLGLGRALTDQTLLVGSGYRTIAWASVPDRSVWILLAILGLRCLGTCVTVAGGGVGGFFIPLVVAGALSGSVVGVGDLPLFIVIGMAAFLGAGYRVPLAGVMFVAETTGRPSFVVPGLLAAVAAELMMGRSSITAYQQAAEIALADPAPLGERPEPPPTSAIGAGRTRFRARRRR